MASWLDRSCQLVLCAIALLAAPAHTAAQINCGDVELVHTARQYGTSRAVEQVARTTVPNIALCYQNSQTEAWVEGVGGADVQEGYPVSEVYRIMPVPSYGNWNTTAKHWAIRFGGFWEFRGHTFGQANVVAPVGGGGPGVGDDCRPRSAEEEIEDCESPIVISPSGRYQLTNAEQGVAFDIDGDGSFEHVAWTHPDDDVYFLVMDRNENGVVDSGRELFGNRTPAYVSDESVTVSNGFEGLKFLHNPEYGPSHLDGVIDSRDSVWSRLRLWKDANQNGISEPEELYRPADVGLLEIALDYKRSGRRDRHGNEHRLRSMATFEGPSGIRRVPCYDVWLMTR